ncbi:amidase [Rubrivirga sp.]|uniref:amidase n=1 Tax=Rubrivirga sp. TaxID=1885344 RepID=UPI003B51CE23
MTDRRRFLASAGLFAAGAAWPASALPAPLDAHRLGPGAPPADGLRPDLTVADLACAEAVQGLAFSDADRALMLDDVAERLDSLAAIRDAEPPNGVPPALVLDLGLSGRERPGPGPGAVVPRPALTARPADDRDLAFASIPELGALLRSGAVTSVGLTELFLGRLRQFDPVLQAVVTLTTDRALDTARARDRELAAGVDRGPLHGIPYGAKDLLAARSAPTTWGAEPYREQVLDEDAVVVRRLEEAGAVLVAKLTLGALAWGDVWFGGTTKNPWNPDQGASGSSAGPGAAVAAGLVPFAIGSETLGSIVSPSTRNGVTGLRPTFGRVPTTGAMALSWSMDKLGPMTRSAVDAALVFDAIRGPETGEDAAFPFRPDSPLADLRVGVVPPEGDDAGVQADRETLAVLSRLGVRPVEVAWPDRLPVGALRLILEAEAAAAFDGLTRSRGTDRLVRQERNAWPNVFRHARFIPAVEYINANRIRTQLMRAMTDLMDRVDVLVTPSFNDGLLITNLTGHPAVAIPNALLPVDGFPDRRQPHSITFVAPLWHEHHALRLAHAVQEATDHHRQRPPVG